MSGMPYDTPRPDHTCPHHPAGARACYVHHACRCRACVTTYSNWQARYRAGLTGRIPAAAILAHVAGLQRSGVTPTDVAIAAGIPEATLRTILAGRVRSVNRATARAILATRPTPGSRGYVDATGTARRLQALAAIGWDSAMIADRLGITGQHIRSLRGRERPLVHATTRRRVADLYDQLSMVPPPEGPWVRRSRTWAARRGWVPPLAWDDDPTSPHSIDNPDAKPSTPGPDRKPDADAETISEVDHLLACGISVRVIAGQLGYDCPSSLARWLHRHDRPDLACRFERKSA